MYPTSLHFTEQDLVCSSFIISTLSVVQKVSEFGHAKRTEGSDPLPRGHCRLDDLLSFKGR